MRTNRLSHVGRLSRILAALAVFLAVAGTAFAGSITLAWDPSPSGDAAGYLVVYGTAPGAYTTTVNVGNQTSVTLRGLADGQTYFFAIKAVSATGVVSAPSNEVSGTSTNTAPQVTTPGSQTTSEGASVNLPVSAVDAEGDPLTFSSTNLPLGLFVDSVTGVISGIVAYTEAGSHSVTITVSDGATQTNVAFTWFVTAVDQQPIVGSVADRSSPVGAVVSLQTVASDPDGDMLSYTAIGMPPGLTINATTGLVSGTLTAAGSYTPTLRASDGTFFGFASFAWTVLPANDPPSIAAPGNQESSIVHALALQLSASDADSNTLTFYSSGLPPGLTLDKKLGLISGQPTTTGVFSVTVTVSDGLATANQGFDWTIDADSAPVVPNPGSQSSVEGQFVSLQLVASDPEGIRLAYIPTLLPPGLSVNDKGLIAGLVPIGSAAVYNAVITVSDGSQQTSVSFSWTISAAAPTPPMFVAAANFAVDRNSAVPNQANLSVNVSGTNTMLVVAFHSEGDGADQNWSVTDNGVQGTLLVNTNGYSGGANNRRFRIYYWLNPSQGANAIFVGNSWVASNELAVSAVVLSNVLQSGPVGVPVVDVSTSGRTSEGETVTTTASDLVLHVIADALFVRGTLSGGETSVAVANDGLPKSGGGDGDASLWIATKLGAFPSTTVGSSGWPGSPSPAPRVINGVAIPIHGAQAIVGPDLIVSATHVDPFTQGQGGAVYTLIVTNGGNAPTSDVVSVLDTLPSGLTATSISGAGWDCSVAALSCTRNNALSAGVSYPPILLTVTVAGDAAGVVVNSVTVGGNDVNSGNNTATDQTLIIVPGVPVTPAFVQMNYSTPQTAQTVVAVTYGAAQVVGDLNVVVVGWNDSNRSVQSVVDSRGNVYVRAVGPTARAGFGAQSIYYAKNIIAAAAGTNLVTVTFDGSTVFPDIRIAEYSGLDYVNPVDVVVGGQGSSATSDSGAVTTTSSTDLLVAGNTVATGTTAPGAGYIARTITDQDGDILMDRVVTATGSYSATAPLSSTGSWVMQLVAFRAAGSTGSQTPTITSRTPGIGPAGTVVTLTGTSFGVTQGTSTVRFNGTTATPTAWSATSITVPVPAGATSGNIIVTVGGVSSNGWSFTVLPTPGLTFRTPGSGPVGAVVSISGTNFGVTQDASTVAFNGTMASPTAWSDTALTVPVPAGATSGNIVVTVAGVTSNGLPFTVLPTPTLTSRTPDSGHLGTVVTLTGTNFGATPGASTVRFNGVAATASAWSDTSISVFVPSGATSGIIVVTVGGVASNGLPFIVFHAPTLATIPNQTSSENDSINVAMNASDPDGDALMYTATGLPASLSINPTTGAITGTLTYTSAGTYDVIVTVSDGELNTSQSFTWTVMNVDRAPVLATIADQTSAENTTVSLTVSAPDPDGDAVTYSATGLPPGLTIGSSSGTIGGLLSFVSAGSYNATVTASDGTLSAIRSFTWTVTDVETTPVVGPIGDLTTTTAATVLLQVNGSDADGDAVTFSATGLPVGIAINPSTGVITGAPTTAGVYSVTVTAATDGGSPSQSFVWTVKSSGKTNHVAFVQATAGPIPPAASIVTVPIAAAQHAGDLNVVVVAWRDNTAQVVSVADAAGNVYQAAGSPATLAGLGTQVIYFAHNVAAGGPGTNSVTVTFNGSANQPAVRLTTYGGIATTMPLVGATSGTGNGVTADSGIVTTPGHRALLVGALLAGETVDAADGAYPDRMVSSAGTDLLEARAVGLAGDYTATATLHAAAPWLMQLVAFDVPNNAPVLTAPGDQSIGEGSLVTLALAATDADQDALTFGATGLPPLLILNPATGVISGTLTFESAGSHTVTVTATDGESTATQTFTWSVTNVNRAPVLASIADRTDAENAFVVIAASATDLDGDAVSYSATGLPPGVTIDASSGVISGLLSYSTAGAYNVTVFANDGTLAASRSFTWTVTNTNRAPVLVSMGNLTTVIGVAVTLQASATDPDGDTVTYGATWLPPGVTIDSSTGVLTGAPAAAGVYDVAIIAIDGSTSAGLSFIWTVTTAPTGRVIFIQAHSSSVLTSVAAITVAYPAPQIQGSLNVVVVGWKDPSAQVLSVADSKGNIYQLAVGPTTRPEVGGQAIYYAANVVAAPIGANTITVTFTSPANKAEVRLVEYQGIEPTNVVDVTAGAQGSSGEANSGPVTTTFRNDLLFGAVWSPLATTAPEDGMTARLTTVSGALLEDATVSAVGSYTVRASVAPPSPWIIQMVAFRDTNHAPLLTNPGDLTNLTTIAVSLPLVASDVDGDTLTFSATGLPAGLSINSATGVISGTISLAAAGVHSVTASVFDGALTTNATFSWTVTPPSVSANSATLNPGSPATLIWTSIGSPTSTDWIGLFATGAPDSSPAAWWFTTGSTSGNRVVTLSASLSLGTYELRLFAQNTTRLAVSGTLTAAGATLSGTPAALGPSGTVTATWSSIGSPTATDWIVLVSTTAPDSGYIAWGYTTGAGSGSRSIVVPASAAPGTYELRLFAQNSFRRLATSSAIAVQATSITAGPTTVLPGNPVTATWSSIGAPTTTDWIALARTSAADTSYVAWGYANGASGGSRTLTMPRSATAGTYELRLFAKDSFKRIAVSNTITVAAVTLVSSPTTLAPGGTLTVTWQNIGAPSATDWLALVPVGALDANWVAWIYGTGRANDSTLFTIPATLSAGNYEVRLFSNNSAQRLAVSNAVTVTVPGPTLATSPAVTAAGGTLTLSWRNIAAPTSTDWIGVYTAGSPDASFLSRVYTNGRPTDRMLMTLAGDLSTGSYELRLFSNDTLTRLAVSNGFEVTAAAMVASSPVTVAAGATLSVAWAGIAAPTSTDWVGLIPLNGPDLSFLAWRYTTGASSGAAGLVIPASVPTGTYELRLFAHDTIQQRLAVSNLIKVGPTLSMTPSPVAPGGTMTARWAGIATPTAKDWLALVPTNAADSAWVAWVYTGGLAAGSKAFVLPSGLPAGSYDIRLFANDTLTRLALSDVVTITAPGPSVSVSPVTTTSGSTVTANWKGVTAPTATDWIGVYVSGAADNAFITRVFTGGAALGSTPVALPGGLANGAYELRLFTNDTLTRLAVGNVFSIQ